MNKVVLFLLFASVLLVTSLSVVATPSPLNPDITFTNSVIKEGVTDFEWCFDSPFKTDKTLLTEDFFLYTDNDGCEITDIKIYSEIESTQNLNSCHLEKQCETIATDYKNGTTQETVCIKVEVCENNIISYKDRFNLKQTDLLMSTNDRVCLTAKRNAKVSDDQSCDMNFIYDDGVTYFDVKDYGFAWWNTTWQKKYYFNISQVSVGLGYPFKVTIDSSFIDVNDCQADFGDLRVVNLAENEELVFNYSNLVSGTSIDLFVNESILGQDFEGYIYCNASGTQSTTAVPLKSLELTQNLGNFYTFDNKDFTGTTLIDRAENKNATFGDGITTGQSGVSNESFLFDGVKGSVNISNWNGFNIGVGDYTVCYFLDKDRTGTNEIYWSLRSASGNTNHIKMLYIGGTFNEFSHYVSPDLDTITNNTDFEDTSTFHHLCQGRSGNNLFLSVDGNIQNQTTNPQSITSGKPLTIGAERAPNLARPTNGKYDNFGFWNRDLTAHEIGWLNSESTYPFYSENTQYFGASEDQTVDTVLNTGILDSLTGLILPNITGEDQKFRVFTNYTYADNSTAITNETGVFCNYSANNIEDETLLQNLGVNTSVCGGGGCDSTNYTFEFKDMEVGEVNHDTYTFEICRQNNIRPFRIDSSCSEQYLFSGSEVPLCSAGFVNITIESNNCTSEENVNISISSDGVTPSNSLILVNTFGEIDRNHNETSNLTFNVTSGLWEEIDQIHSYIEHGTKIINVACTDPLALLENQIDQISITVVNNPPLVFIDSIWWWLLGDPVLFTPSIQARYPLLSTINITLLSSDDDLDVTQYYFNYSNGTNIFTGINGGNLQLNLTQSNFSTAPEYLNGSLEYIIQIIANDTFGDQTELQKSFSAINQEPTLTLNNASPINTQSAPINISWSCTDPESESVTSTVYVNSTLNKTGLDQFYIFNQPEGSYNVSVRCNDTFYNVSDEVIVNFNQACFNKIDGLCVGCVYPDLEQTINISCTNSATITDCFYKINEYAEVSPSTCGGFNVTLMRGWNNIKFKTTSVGVNRTTEYNVFARGRNDSILNYPFVIILGGLILVFGILGGVTKSSIFDLVSIPLWIVLGYNLVAFSSVIGLTIGIMGVLASLTMVWGKGF